MSRRSAWPSASGPLQLPVHLLGDSHQLGLVGTGRDGVAQLVFHPIKHVHRAIFAKLEAEARGMYEILTKQAEGLERIVKSAGNDPKDAVLLLIVTDGRKKREQLEKMDVVSS